MANSAQALKRARQNKTHYDRNRAVRSKVRTLVKKFEAALESGDKEAINTTFKTTMAELHRAAGKGAMTKGAADRKVSRMAAAIRATK